MKNETAAALEAKIAKLYGLLEGEGTVAEVPAVLAKLLHKELVKTESDLARLGR